VRRELDALRRDMGVSRRVRVVVSGIIGSPMTTGLWRPLVILPLALVTGGQVEPLRLLLAHELAHIRRFDYLVTLLQNVLRVLFFYHPVVRWVTGLLDEERELCCDHLALAHAGSPLDYAGLRARPGQPAGHCAGPVTGAGSHWLRRTFAAAAHPALAR
jgi:beta-lactamase regulating signal transducer with metallopeptidase domain